MSTYEPPAGSREPGSPEGSTPGAWSGPRDRQQDFPPRVGTAVWGLVVVALAALIIVAQLGIMALNGTYVLIGLMIGAGAALVAGGLLSARGRDKTTPTRKS